MLGVLSTGNSPFLFFWLLFICLFSVYYRFAKRPDQWKLRQASKQSALKEFYDAFGPPETKFSETKNFLADASRKSQPDKMKEMRKEIDSSLAYVAPDFGNHFLAHQGSNMKSKKSGLKRPGGRASLHNDAMGGGDLRNKKKRKRNSNN